MPALTRRRDPQSRREAWLIHYGDVQLGTIGLRSGAPATADQWAWSCGFHPLRRQEHATAADLFKARAAFEAAWRRLFLKVTKANFDEHRRQCASTWKYAMWDAGCKMPTQMADGRSRCFCGAAIDVETASQHVTAVHLDMR